MKDPQSTTNLCRRSSCGFTLMEVVVGMILMATLVVGSLTALSRYRRSLADEARKRQAIAVADQLLDQWVFDTVAGCGEGRCTD